LGTLNQCHINSEYDIVILLEIFENLIT